MVARPRFDVDELVQDDRVHSRIYTDPHIFTLEMERIFGRCWVYVAHESEVAQPGDYKATFIGLQPVIVTRDADAGEIHVLYNRCRHRAATVCQEERGTAHYFRCAYHGWTYNNRGELIGVPYRQGYGEDFTYAAYGLAKVPRVASYRGFIFASLSPDVPSLDDWLGNARPYLDAFAAQGGGIEVRSGVQKLGFNGNWKLQLENTVDGYHTNFVHQSYFEITKQRSGKARRDTYTLRLKTRDLGNGHVVLDIAEIVRGLAPAGMNTGGFPGFNLVVFPNLALLFAQIRHILPVAVDRTEVRLYPTLLRGASPEVNEKRLREHEDFYGPASFANPDDLEMFVRSQIGFQAQGNAWVLFNRGLHHEVTDEHGVRLAARMDETSQRGIYRAWKRMMMN